MEKYLGKPEATHTSESFSKQKDFLGGNREPRQLATAPEQGLMLCCSILGLIVGIVIGMVWAYEQVHGSPAIWIDRLEKQMEAGR